MPLIRTAEALARAGVSAAVAVAAGAASGVASTAGAAAGTVGQKVGRMGPRRWHRRVWARRGRAHIEVHGIGEPGCEEMCTALERRLSGIEGVHWAQVIPVLGRAVVAFDPDGPTLEDLIDIVEGIEDEHRTRTEPFPADRPEHPGDTEPMRRNAIALGADALALGGSLFGQLLQLTPIPAELASAVTLLDHEPKVRHVLERHLGQGTTDVGLGIASALAQALSQGPVGVAVDMTHRVNLISELHARRRCWERAERSLHAAPYDEPVAPVHQSARPTPLPPGPAERYADRAAAVSLAAFGASLLVTGSPRRSAALVTASLAKAARHGRDAFAAQLGRELARRDVVLLDGSVLGRLDRVDWVVLDAAAVRTGRLEPARCRLVGRHTRATASTPVSGRAGAADARARIAALYHPGRVRRRDGWSCGPLPALVAQGVHAPQAAVAVARSLGRGGSAVAALARGEELVALAEMVPIPDPLAAPLVEAARARGLHVAVAGGGAALASSLGADRSVPGAMRLTGSVRRLQRDGAVVLLVAGSGADQALHAADCAVGVLGGGPPPWAADVLTGPGLLQASLVVQAAATAAAVSRRSALIALGGSAVGGVWAVAGPSTMAATRAALPMNAASLVAQVHGVVSAAAFARQPPPAARIETTWHAMDAGDVLDALGSGPDGLSEEEGARRRSDRRREPSIAEKLGGALRAEFANPLTPLLAAGAGLSAAVGSVTDAGLVAGVTTANAVIGAAQRLRADVSIARLTHVNDTVVDVVRSGSRHPVDRRHLVAGDVVALRAGDVVPADCRVLSTSGCEIDESAVTGESLPVTKGVAPTPGAPLAERSSMLYEGTTVSSGSVLAVAVAVGDDTELGRVVADAPEPPPSGVEARLSTLTAATLPATVLSGGAVTALGLLRGRSPRRAVTSGVGLTVAAVPEGLPLLATTAQQAAARRLAARGALVRNPRTIEALGRVDTLCFDKTGTLTLGEIRLQRVSDGTTDDALDSLGPRTRAVLAAAVRACPEAGDGGSVGALLHATDRAVISGALAAGVSPDEGVGTWNVAGELAFDPVRGFHAVWGSSARGTTLCVKGAPEVVLPRCATWRDDPLDARRVRRLDAEVERLAGRGLRVLAVAERTATTRSELDEERVRDLELLGFVALADSVRPTAAAAVNDLRDAGVDVVMVTGDHPSTAAAVARELGILNGHRVVSGADLDAMDDQMLADVLADVSVFARVTPIDKVRIVRAYQRAGRIVAMTGDGANDAPAIRLAHTGIALGSRSTAPARGAADLVVVDDRMETILDAVAEGRAMWVSVRDALAILVGGNIGEVAFSLMATALTGASPLDARQFLLVNLMTDMVPAMAVALRAPKHASPAELLAEGPDRSLGTALAGQIGLRAATTASGATGAWMLARATGRRRRASTVALAALVGTQLGQTAVVGRDSPLVLASTAISAGALVAVVQTPGLSHFFGCTPLGPLGWSIALGSAAVATGASVLVPRLGGHRDVARSLPGRQEAPRERSRPATSGSSGPRTAAADRESP